MDFFISTMKTLEFIILWNPASRWILAILVYITILFSLKNIIKFIVKRIHKFIENKKRNIIVAILKEIEDIQKYFYIAIELFIPLQLIKLPNIIDHIINGIFTFIMLIQIIHIANNILVFSLKKIFTKQGKLEKTTVNAIRLIVKVLLWTIGWIILLSTFGIEISPLLASLWIWGLAIAFAAQNMLQDLFSSFSIIISKPFKVWDYIKIDNEHSGVVNHITLKATHITSIKGHDIRLPNKDILNGKLENFATMKHRRVRFNIWVEYGTPTKLLKQIPKIIENIINKYKDDINFERAKMTELSTYSINFKISYDIHSKDYQLYLSKNQSILLDILEAFEKNNIKIAYPTQTIHTTNKKS